MKLLRKTGRWIGRILSGIIVLAICLVGIVRLGNYLTYHISTAGGVDEGIYVELNGQQQFIRVRGENVNNPVIIWLHGGPASPDGFVDYVWEKDLVDQYTIITWDQRGCGRTYFRNQANDPDNETATFEQAVQDVDALVDYVERRFAPKDIVIVGHSYGTMVGSKYALEHPDRIRAYIGVGQVVTMESELYSYEDALQKAKAQGDDTAAMEEAFRNYAEDTNLINMQTARQLAAPYHKAEREKNTIWQGVKSSFMGIDDLRWFLKQMGDIGTYFALNGQLFDYILTADVREYGMTYELPVGFITGESDWTTPAAYSEDYCEQITAPDKRYELISGCGHSPQFDAPEEFAETLGEMLQAYLQK